MKKKINPQLQDKIHQAMLEEYSKKGFENASTNCIIKEAGISKGSLFNYMGNKKEQYFSLIDSILKQIINYMRNEITQLPKDFFDQLIYISQVKIRVSLLFPREYKLLIDAYLSDNEEVKRFMKTKYQMFSSESVSSHFDRLDPELLIDPSMRKHLSEMVFYIISGYTENFMKTRYNKETSMENTITQMTEELSVYFNHLRLAFFKEDIV